VFFRRAIHSLEGQISALGGAQEVRSDLRPGTTIITSEFAALLIKSGRPDEAFAVSEQFRARPVDRNAGRQGLAVRRELPEKLLEIEPDFAGIQRGRRRIVETNPVTDQRGVEQALGALAAFETIRKARLRSPAESPRVAALSLPAADRPRRLPEDAGSRDAAGCLPRRQAGELPVCGHLKHFEANHRHWRKNPAEPGAIVAPVDSCFQETEGNGGVVRVPVQDPG